MTRLPRTWTTTVAAAALLGSLAWSVHAQPVAPQGTAHAHHQARHGHASPHAPADLAARQTQRTERLRTLLQIQPQQQAAFDSFVQATTPQHAGRKALAPPAELQNLSTPERIAHAQAQRKARTQQAEQREQATLRFYQSLNSSQQKAFDVLHTQGPRHEGGRAMRGGDHRGAPNQHPAPRTPRPAPQQAPAL